MEIGIRQAKAELSKLIQAVLAGEQIVITSHGKPVAELVRPNPGRKRRARGYGSLRGVLRLPQGWDSPEAEEELLHQFDFYREGVNKTK